MSGAKEALSGGRKTHATLRPSSDVIWRLTRGTQFMTQIDFTAAKSQLDNTLGPESII